MTVEQRYYQLAGYWSVPCMCVPLLALFALRVWSNGLFLAFGTVGLLCAISGFLRGGLKARLCAVTALIVFGALAFVFLCESRWFQLGVERGSVSRSTVTVEDVLGRS